MNNTPHKTVYIAIATDILHSGHMNVIEEGAKYGDVIIGLLTDEAIATYKRMPILDFETRKRILESMKYVTKVIPQETLSYAPYLRELKPDYVIHGRRLENRCAIYGAGRSRRNSFGIRW